MDRRIEITRYGEVDEEQLPAPVRALHRLCVEDEAGRARRRDDDVRARELRADLLERYCVGAEALRELMRAVDRPIGDKRDVCASGQEIARGLLADLPRADEQDLASLEVPEHLLGERRRGGGDRRGAFADRRLYADFPTGVQGLAKHPVEEPPGSSGLVGAAYLAEDLALAGHERVETGGDAEQVERSGLVA